MNSRGQFVIEGIKQAGKVFVVSLLLLLLAELFPRFSGTNGLDAAGSFFGVFWVIDMIVAALFGSTLAGPVPWTLIHFDISDRELFVLSCLFVVPYWALLGTLAGHIRWSSFSGRSPQEPVPSSQKISKQIRLIVEGSALAIAAFSFFGGPLIPNFGPGQRFPRAVIINHLRQIDAAKNEFALEHKVDPSYVPTIADLSPYIRLTDGKLPHYGPECYVISAITNPPYAILTNDLWVPRRGWQEGHLVGTNGQIFRLPAEPLTTSH
jgi:hypothetical protein